MKRFYNVLFNTLIANVTTSFLWFGLTFWVYLETRNVMATAIIGGSYMLLIAFLSLVFGTIVDHNKKKTVMLWASAFTLATYLLAGLIFVVFPDNELVNWMSPAFWIFALIILIGSVVENMRNIALSTVVTLLVPKKLHANANGLVGAVQGLGFLVTSVFSGLAIGFLGMGWVLGIAIVLTAVAFIHLLFVSIPEKKILHDPELAGKKIDIKGSIAAIKAVPGLGSLIFFTTFNNLVGGVFMALMDPYGLTLFSVQIWGLMLGLTSTGFILGGLIISKTGLGKNPIRTLLLVNLGIGVIGMVFAIREIWLLYTIGIFGYMLLFPVIEAAEQTIIQRVVPFKRQGRVFGFAQSIEAAAAPITAFMIGPLAQFMVIPFMRSDEGNAKLGWLLGEGDARGIALIFMCAGFVALLFTFWAFTTKAYRRLSKSFAES
jgi:DHA3 family multidrug efflux protein-like MFS transporter